MFINRTRIAAAAFAVITLGATIFAAPSEAQARHWGWGGFGVGLAAGALFGAAAAGAYAGPAYVYYPRCRWIRQFDPYGYYIGRVRVCRY